VERLRRRPSSAATFRRFKDWEAFAKHVRKNPDDITLLQRRLSVEACRERFDAKQVIPGVEIFTKVSLSLIKVKK
jgi:hypothetical protein